MIDEYQDIISSLDVIERIAELQAMDEEDRTELDDEELTDLLVAADEGESYVPDWKYGVDLINDSYFEQYAQEFTEELHSEIDFSAFPFYCIDWAEAAGDMQYDYVELTMPNGQSFWVRQG